jgi:hypothetical protein
MNELTKVNFKQKWLLTFPLAKFYLSIFPFGQCCQLLANDFGQINRKSQLLAKKIRPHTLFFHGGLFYKDLLIFLCGYFFCQLATLLLALLR